MSRRIIPTILGRGRDFQVLSYLPLFGLSSTWELSRHLWLCHLACWLRIMVQSEVDLSVILDTFDSNLFMLCPWAMSFFQTLCPAPFPPVTVSPTDIFCKRKNVSSPASTQGLHGGFGSVSLYCLCLQRSLVCPCHSWPGSLSRLSPDKVVLVLKNPPSSAGDIRDVDSIPGFGRSPGGGHGNPLQYSHGQRSLVGYSS